MDNKELEMLKSELEQSRNALNFVNNSLTKIEQRLDMLAAQQMQPVQSQTMQPQPVPVQQPQPVPVAQPKPVQQEVQNIQPVPQPAPRQMQQPVQPRPQAQPMQQPVNNISVMQEPIRTTNIPASAKGKNVEALVGKIIMGVVASVLIFISLILFATLVLPILGNALKMVLMYGVSLAFTVFGLFKLRKDKSNALFLSISACGVGAIYISLFLTNAYFHAIGEIPLYILLFIWALFTLTLSKNGMPVFHIVGNAGIAISVIFGTALCVSGDCDKLKFLVLIVYFITGSMSFYIFNLKDNLAEKINYIFNAFSTFVLLIGLVLINLNGGDIVALNYAAFGFMMAYCVGMIAVLIVEMKDEKIVSKSIFGLTYSLLALGFIRTIFCYNIELSDIFVMIASILILVFTELRIRLTASSMKKSGANAERVEALFNNPLCIIWQVLILIIGAGALAHIEGIGPYTSAMPVVIAVLIYGYLGDRKLYKIMGMIMAYTTYLTCEMSPLMIIMWTGILMIILHGAPYIKKEYGDGVMNISTYILTFLTLIRIVGLSIEKTEIDSDILIFVGYLAALIINVIYLVTKHGKIKGQERLSAFTYIGYAINALLIIMGMALMAAAELPVLHGLYTASCLVAVMITVRRFVGYKNILADMYVAFKITLFIIVAFSTWSAPAYLVSIALFVLSIISIFLGFAIGNKFFRIYGLVLSMLCVIKLIVLDINYANTLGRALSFFVSGILCFVISAIYYVAEKRIEK